jgi:transposase-like protein
MSVGAFAAEHGLNRHTLQWWRCHLRDDGRMRSGATPAFIEIATAPANSMAGTIEAQLPSGVIVRGHDGDQVARLVTALLRPC